jgi:uncharacterized membrane protein YgcG
MDLVVFKEQWPLSNALLVKVVAHSHKEAALMVHTMMEWLLAANLAQRTLSARQELSTQDSALLELNLQQLQAKKLWTIAIPVRQVPFAHVTE